MWVKCFGFDLWLNGSVLFGLFNVGINGLIWFHGQVNGSRPNQAIT